MATAEQKDKIINDIYFEASGFGSVKTTYTDARMKDKRITLKYVQDWFSKTLEATKQPGGTNSFVAQEAYFEYQVDLFFINDLKKTEVYNWYAVHRYFLEVRSGGAPHD